MFEPCHRKPIDGQLGAGGAVALSLNCTREL
jgi:hypothetical protein